MITTNNIERLICEWRGHSKVWLDGITAENGDDIQVWVKNNEGRNTQQLIDGIKFEPDYRVSYMITIDDAPYWYDLYVYELIEWSRENKLNQLLG